MIKDEQIIRICCVFTEEKNIFQANSGVQKDRSGYINFLWTQKQGTDKKVTKVSYLSQSSYFITWNRIWVGHKIKH